MSEESGEGQSIGATQTGGEKIKFHRPPRISADDWRTYISVQAQIRNDRGEEPHPGKKDVKGVTSAAELEEFAGYIKKAKIHSKVSSEIDEAHRINATRDRAIKFGLDPDRADDDVFQRDLEMAEDLCNELGLDGETVYRDPNKRSALESLIATEILVKDAEREVTTAKAALTNAQDGLHVKEAVLAQQQSEQVAGRNKLIEVAK